jgi:hypothetical protein
MDFRKVTPDTINYIPIAKSLFGALLMLHSLKHMIILVQAHLLNVYCSNLLFFFCAHFVIIVYSYRTLRTKVTKLEIYDL